MVSGNDYPSGLSFKFQKGRRLKPHKVMPKKILVVDDDEAIIRLLEMALEEYTVITACDGREAIRIADENIPDLIILDINLPYLNGFDACKFLKKDGRTKTIPIIMMTANSGNPEIKERCLGLGAKRFIEKPFSITDFLTCVEGLLDHV